MGQEGLGTGMDDIARAILAALGGKQNILTNTVCMTRLRVTMRNPQDVDYAALNDITGVLGTAARGSNGLEVVFGPRVIDQIYHAFLRLTGIEAGTDALFPMSRQSTNLRVQINATPRTTTPLTTNPHSTGPAPAEAAALPTTQSDDSDVGCMDAPARQGNAGLDQADIETLMGLFADSPASAEVTQTTPGGPLEGATSPSDDKAVASIASRQATPTGGAGGSAPAHPTTGARPLVSPHVLVPLLAGRSANLLVINGPNVNMIGLGVTQNPEVSDFSAILELCRQTAVEVGFARCVCLQSNHEGDLVDWVQEAWGSYNAIVINPASLGASSIALEEAIAGVGIPTAQVSMAMPAEPSRLDAVCSINVTGEGVRGYAHAIRELAYMVAG